MTKKIFLTAALIISFLITIKGQTNSPQNLNNRLKDKSLGISFIKEGKVTQSGSTTYNIVLSSSATAHVSAVNKLFVDLPGSYGGRVYLDSPVGEKIMHNRILVDSINTGQQKLKREYWAVYGGMGMWDCVINCYAYVNGKYYIVSMVQDKMMGKPGEIINGKQISSKELRMKILSSLQDTTNTVVKKFNGLLASFQIQH